MKIKKKYVISFILILICNWFELKSYAQTKLTNEISANHKLLKGTKVFIIPPAEYRLSFNSLGFGDTKTGANVGAFQSERPIDSIKRHLSKNYLIGRNYKIIEIAEYQINQLQAVWYELETEFYDRTTIKYILIIGNSKEHAMIEAYCPKEHQSASIELKKSIFSIYYDIDSMNINKMNPRSNLSNFDK